MALLPFTQQGRVMKHALIQNNHAFISLCYLTPGHDASLFSQVDGHRSHRRSKLNKKYSVEFQGCHEMHTCGSHGLRLRFPNARTVLSWAQEPCKIQDLKVESRRIRPLDKIFLQRGPVWDFQGLGCKNLTNQFVAINSMFSALEVHSPILGSMYVFKCSHFPNSKCSPRDQASTFLEPWKVSQYLHILHCYWFQPSNWCPIRHLLKLCRSRGSDSHSNFVLENAINQYLSRHQANHFLIKIRGPFQGWGYPPGHTYPYTCINVHGLQKLMYVDWYEDVTCICIYRGSRISPWY